MTAPATTVAHDTGQEGRSRALRWRDFPMRGKALAGWFVALVVLVGIFSAIGAFIVGPFGATVDDLDRSISQWVAQQRTPLWNELTWWGSTLADSWVKIPAALLLVGFFLARWKRWFEAALLGGGLILESSAFVITSFIVGRDRPAIEQLDPIPPTGAFPSGHTAAAVVFYGAIAMIVWANTSNRWARSVAATVAVIVPVVVALSRVYRGMHFASDVVAGSILGLASLAAMWWLLRSSAHLEPRDGGVERSIHAT